MRSKKYHFLLVFLFGLEILSLFLVYKTFSNKDVKAIKEIMEIDKKQFAMYVENEEGKYKEYTSSNIFPVGYKINLSKSSCVDTKGNKINGILSGTSNSVTVTSNKTTYCYMYFDVDYKLSQLCKNGDNLGSCLTTNNEEIDSLNDSIEGGLFRYQGTNEIVDDNYICFGTTSKYECISHTDKYMYRIIGIDSNGQLKLIKKEALNEQMHWNDTSSKDMEWLNSLIYLNINGEKYLTNATYMTNEWSNKIVNYEWKYGKNSIEFISAKEIYEIENEWTNTITAKIGLMYAYDYAFGIKGGNNCSDFAGYNICKTSWLHLSNNESTAVSEWTMSNYGYYSYYDGDYYNAWGIYSNGILGKYTLASIVSIRPVFYLKNDETYVSGDGTISNPIVISDIN